MGHRLYGNGHEGGDYMRLFKDYPKFISDLKEAIADERSAIDLYTRLHEIAPTETARYAVKVALDDEIMHDRKLTKLYVRLTGREPDVHVKRVEFHHFYDGLHKAFLDEVEAFEFYKEMYLSTYDLTIRDILYSIQHDEIEHATLFNWVHTEIK